MVAWLMRLMIAEYILIALSMSGCIPQSRYTDCVEWQPIYGKNEVTCRRIGTELYRTFKCDPDSNRCVDMGFPKDKRTIFVPLEATP